ncbi:hotdog domain-containing protein, partial [Brevundimonas sp.]|uniref:acyl-CoA thioesterase n=1 Tax=Brevundimonas sp. TaxID=1871086 RepID=UPI0025C38D24
MSDAPEYPPETRPVGRIIAMPADTNPEGDIFGGWLLAQMDVAGATPAFELAQGRCATVALDGMVFHQPVAGGAAGRLYAAGLSPGRPAQRLPGAAGER